MLQVIQFNRNFLSNNDTATAKIAKGVYDKKSFFEIENKIAALTLDENSFTM